MILVKTPIRISFSGGGSDYFQKNVKYHGRVLTTTIDKYIYILINKKYNSEIRVSYSKTENVKNVSQIQHNIIKQSLKEYKIKNGIEIVTSADIPSSGSGLGSSSSLAVGLVNGLSKLNNINLTKSQIAYKAAEIEINRCNKPIGFQDQFATSFGGLKYIQFINKKNIRVDNIKIGKKRENNFKNNLILFYTGINRKADKILSKITKNKNHIKNHDNLSLLAKNFYHELIYGDLDNCGSILHENWMIKRSLNKTVSTLDLDYIYNYALKSGAIGGKLLGAGGGGYFLFYVKKEKQKKFLKSIKKIESLSCIDFNFENNGTTIINC
tara:strand:- start:10 stop:984 length:975 start_codon:yes stop_codon:yes gene_type:complete